MRLSTSGRAAAMSERERWSSTPVYAWVLRRSARLPRRESESWRRLVARASYVLATGTELRAPGTTLEPGEIYDSNRPMIAAMLARFGARCRAAAGGG